MTAHNSKALLSFLACRQHAYRKPLIIMIRRDGCSCSSTPVGSGLGCTFMKQNANYNNCIYDCLIDRGMKRTYTRREETEGADPRPPKLFARMHACRDYFFGVRDVSHA